MSIVGKLFGDIIPEIASKATSDIPKMFDVPPTNDKRLIDLALANVENVTSDFKINPAKTQRANTTPTYDKAFEVLGIKEGDTVLDYGAGLGLGSRSAKEKGANVVTFEPFPQKDFQPDFTNPEDVPSNIADKLVNMNVLNVLPKDMRDQAVVTMGRALKPMGEAIINTRSAAEVNATKNKTASGDGWIVGTGKERTFQKGFTPKELQAYVKEILGSGFAVDPVKNLSGASVKIKKLPEQIVDVNASSLPQPFEGM